MAYWKAQLHQFVPKTELSRNSDYTEHAQWMSALKELAPQSYEILLAQWRVEHYYDIVYTASFFLAEDYL